MGIVGLDTLSLSLIILSFWIRMMIIIRRGLVFKIYFSENKFLLIILLLLFRLLGSFISINILIFYFFFEFSLFPTLLLIIGWGYQPERIQAGVYFLFYTLTASLPLLLCLLFIYLKIGSLIVYFFFWFMFKWIYFLFLYFFFNNGFFSKNTLIYISFMTS